MSITFLIRSLLSSLVITIALVNFASANDSTAPTDAQATAIIESLISRSSEPPVKTALKKFQKKATMQEKRDFLTGAKSIDLPKPKNSVKKTNLTESSLPKCKPHYGCRFRSVCHYNKWTDVNSCEVVIDNCPDPTCD